MERLAARLAEARSALAHTQKSMAAAVGCGFRSWQDYEAGRKVPGAQVVAGVAALGISGHWLLTGEGPMRVDPSVAEEPGPRRSPPAAPGIDTEVLTVALEAVEARLRGRQLAPDKRAELVTLLYVYMAKDGEAEPAVLDHLIRLAS